MIEWTTILFWYLFIDLTNNASVGAKAREAAARSGPISMRRCAKKACPSDRDDILNRCLAMQAAKLPAWTIWAFATT